jgi:DNA ligase (NAD+)
MIIPQLVRAEQFVPENSYIFDPPDVCPICGGPTEIKDDFLYCTNPSCSGRLINRVDHYAGKKGLDIKGLSEATLEKLIDYGWLNSISDLYKLKEHRDEWVQKEGFGPKSVDNILSTIDERSTNCELASFISALSIPLIGTTFAKEIAKQCAGWL